MFYVAKFEDLQNDSPNYDGNDVELRVSREPFTGNSRLSDGSYAEIVDGWLGTTNNVHGYAHGAFETQEEVDAWVESMGFDPSEGADEGDGIICYAVQMAPEMWSPYDWFTDEPDVEGKSNEELWALAEELEKEANEAVDVDRPYGVGFRGNSLFNYLVALRDEN